MTELAGSLRPHFDIGRVAQRTFAVIGRNPVIFLVLTLILVVVPHGLYSPYFLRQLGPDRSPAAMLALFGSLRGWELFAPSLLISIVGGAMLQASIIHATVADLSGRRATIGECLSTSVRFILPLFAIALVMWFCVAAGFMLLIFPGIMLATAWCVVAPAEVVERTGVFGAFSRSGALTKGHRWAIFAIVLVFFIAFFVVQSALKGISGGMSAVVTSQLNVASIVVSLVMQVLAGIIGNVGVASIYYELRTIKEGIGPEALASVFD